MPPQALRSLPSFYKFGLTKSSSQLQLATNKTVQTSSYSTLQSKSPLNRNQTEKLSFHVQKPTSLITLKRSMASSSSSSSSSSKSQSSPPPSTASSSNDRQLQQSFNSGLLPRFFALQDFLFTEKGRLKFSTLFLNDIIITESLLVGIKLFTDLYNPLLEKYAFNVYEFFDGCKEAFLQINKSIIILHYMNNDLFSERKENYQLLEIHKNLLQTTLSTSLFGHIERQINDKIESFSTSPVFNDYTINLNSLKLNSIIIEKVETKVVDEFYTEYPVGSVLAVIDVRFESEQLYEHSNNPEIINKTKASNQKEVKPKLKRVVSSNWRFEGCISGHVPLHWTIQSMKNYLQKNVIVKK